MEVVDSAGAPDPLEAAIKAVDRAGSRDERREALAALTRVGGGRAARKLGDVAADDAEAVEVRLAAVDLLGSLAEPAAVDELVRLSRVPEPGLASRAGAALGAASDPARLSGVLKHWHALPWWVQAAVARAVERVGRSAVPPLLESMTEAERIDPALLEALRDLGPLALDRVLDAFRDPGFRPRADLAAVLATAADPAALDALAATAAGADDGLALASIRALGAAVAPGAADALVRCVADPRPAIRAAALAELAAAAPGAVAAAAARLGDGDPSVRRAAVGALARLGRHGHDRLRGAIAAAPVTRRLEMVDALAVAGEPAVALLVEQGSDADGRVRRATVDSLGEAVRHFGPGPLRAGGPLLRRLLADDPDPSVRIAAAEALSLTALTEGAAERRRAVRDAGDALLAALADADFRVRAAAATSLGWLDAARATPRLRRIASSEDDPAAVAAVRALGRFAAAGRAPAARALVQLLDSDRRAVRAAALSELEDPAAWVPALGGWEGAPAALQRGLRRCLADDPPVRAVARAVLARVLRGGAEEAQHFADDDEHRYDWREDELDDNGGGARRRRSGLPSEPAAGRPARPGGRPLIAADDEVVKLAARAEPPPPPPRYAELTLLDSDAESPLPRGEALRQGVAYLLEVAVRVEPGGIEPEAGERRPIRETGAAGTVTLTVTAEGDDFEIEEPVAELELPEQGDSVRNARFRVTPTRRTTSPGDVAQLRIRLFLRFALIESVVLTADVGGAFADPGRAPSGAAVPVRFVQERLEREYAQLADAPARSMHVDIAADGDAFHFTFTLADPAGRRVALTAPARLRSTELEDALVSVRDLWDELAMSPGSAGVDGDPHEFPAQLRRLAQAGSRLWTSLFRRDPESAIFRVGRLLEANPIADDGIVQVSVGRGAEAFVFPWALVYDRAVPRRPWELPDPRGFWGIRYAIEQRLPGSTSPPDTPRDSTEPLRIEVLEWDQFRNIADQRALFDRLRRECRGGLEFSDPPINDVDRAYLCFEDCGSQLLYFYAHGYTRPRRADIGGGPDLGGFVRRYEALPAGSPARAAFRLLYESIRDEAFEADRSWIELTYGRLYLDELYRTVETLRSRPLVFLNMCESAQATPSLSESFVHFFLSRRAAGVIGTECPMTVEFAHPFAESILTALLRGEDVGSALLLARRAFMERSNPLGLAYSLYGPATTRFVPPRLAAAAAGGS